ncbi:hypothetical protein GCM10009634_29220 [Saccharothrix xinjiangensis]
MGSGTLEFSSSRRSLPLTVMDRAYPSGGPRNVAAVLEHTRARVLKNGSTTPQGQAGAATCSLTTCAAADTSAVTDGLVELSCRQANWV